MPVASSAPRGRFGGIRNRGRSDRDGDVVMGAAGRVSPARTPIQKNNSTLVELKVTGWTDSTDIPRLTGFLERHASKRSPNASKGSPIIIKSRVEGRTLHIRVLPDNVVAFSKINGFSFVSETHGSQKLVIEGTGITRRRSQSPHDTTNKESSSSSSNTDSTMALFHTFLDQRYSAAEKLLNLSNLRSDVGLVSAGMFQTTTRMAKLFPVLTTILEKRFTTAEDKREAFHSITLSDNNLEDLQLVKTLAHTFPDLKNLDLSNNKFASVKDLTSWKRQFRNLEHLIVTGNPLMSHEGWESDFLTWYPKLRFLNGREVRTEVEVAATLAKTTGEVPTFDNPETLQEYFNNAQQAMVNYVSHETNMTAEYSRHCLTTAGWNLQAAAVLFNEQRATLPPDAFVVPSTT